jgi:hypothetical protein
MYTYTKNYHRGRNSQTRSNPRMGGEFCDGGCERIDLQGLGLRVEA